MILKHITCVIVDQIHQVQCGWCQLSMLVSRQKVCRGRQYVDYSQHHKPWTYQSVTDRRWFQHLFGWSVENDRYKNNNYHMCVLLFILITFSSYIFLGFFIIFILAHCLSIWMIFKLISNWYYSQPMTSSILI